MKSSVTSGKRTIVRPLSPETVSYQLKASLLKLERANWLINGNVFRPIRVVDANYAISFFSLFYHQIENRTRVTRSQVELYDRFSFTSPTFDPRLTIQANRRLNVQLRAPCAVKRRECPRIVGSTIGPSQEANRSLRTLADRTLSALYGRCKCLRTLAVSLVSRSSPSGTRNYCLATSLAFAPARLKLLRKYIISRRAVCSRKRYVFWCIQDSVGSPQWNIQNNEGIL